MKEQKRKYILNGFLIAKIMLIAITNTVAQTKPAFFDMPGLPAKKGFAGMYAGVSHGNLFCMGGANFPGDYPWQGGKKQWYNGIYMLQEGGKWIKIKQELPAAAGYGVSVSYKGEIILIGGCNAELHLDTVFGYTWTGEDLKLKSYPSLPHPLAYMTGGIIENVIVVAGGAEFPGAAATNKCYALDLLNTEAGWKELDSLPGRERMFPVGAVYKEQFYLFSGETTIVNAAGENVPLILQDAYKLTISKKDGQLAGRWEKLAPMPKGAAAASNPLPVLKNGNIFFWGGVDALSRLHKDPASFPGISGDMLLYDPVRDTWSYVGSEKSVTARVTLPVVLWNDRWIYISGETKPGIRTKSVTAFKNF